MNMQSAIRHEPIACVDVDDNGFPIKPCPQCKHPFGEHVYMSIDRAREVGECLHCARYGDTCNVDQTVAWPDLASA